MSGFKTTYDEKLKTWSGIKKERKFPANYSIGQAALEAMQSNAEKIGQICDHNGREYTYKELANFSKSVALHFTKLGLQECDVIGIIASTSDYLAPLFVGAMLNALTVSPMDISYEKEGIRYIFGLTKPKIVFCDGAIYERVKAALQECDLNIDIYTMNGHVDGVPRIDEFLQEPSQAEDFGFKPLKHGGSQTAVIICSSGTTGLPKGVRISNEDLLNYPNMQLQPDDRFLCFTSLDWFSGLYTLVRGTLTGLTRVITSSGFSPENLLHIVENYKITHVMSTPSCLALTLACPKLKTANLSSVRQYYLLGTAVSYALIQKVKPYFPNAKLFNTYGMTETRLATAVGECVDATGFVGQLATNVTYKIIGENGQRLGPNEIGEPHFTNPNKWLGYIGNPEATKAALDAEGWIVSGDLGYFDEQGNLYIVDRKKDILKYDYFHYFPTEIENVIYELEDVLEVCVFGLPDLILIDLPSAAVVKRNGSDLKENDIYEHVARRLESYKHLRGGVYFMQKIPKTSSGKPLRRETKKICEQLRDKKV